MTAVTPTRSNLKALVETDETDVLCKPSGSLHYSENYMGDLMIVGRLDVDGARAASAKLSADGEHWTHEWHQECDGPAGPAVYVERHDETGCAFHGWVDARSRRIVQTG